jgi:hypothetical protein
MSLPDFLGLGAQRAGTTWLDRLLRHHPDIYLPERRKEVHFFDRHFDRGTEWYATFFPPPDRAGSYRRIGEITPRYLYDPVVPERIRRTLPDCRMIALLRDPVSRLYSQYGLHVRDRGERRTFADFVRSPGDGFERGLYSRQLERYLALFDREQILVLIYEEAVTRIEQAIGTLSTFLEVDAEPLRSYRDEGPLNPSFVPRLPRLRAAARAFGAGLRRRGADGIVNAAKRIGVPELFGRRPMPKISPQDDDDLRRRYADEIARLEQLLGRSLEIWKAG